MKTWSGNDVPLGPSEGSVDPPLCDPLKDYDATTRNKIRTDLNVVFKTTDLDPNAFLRWRLRMRGF